MALKVVFQKSADAADHHIKSADAVTAGYVALKDNEEAAKLSPNPQVAQETLAFYNAVVRDGRYVGLLKTDPQKAADNLGLSVSPEVLKTLTRSAELKVDVSKETQQLGEVGVASIAVAVVVVTSPQADNQVVVDSSGLVKL